jgi:quercetin dioxygenase-like cupin family protein
MRAKTGRRTVLDDGTLRLEFLQTTAETDGSLLEMRATYAPHSPWPPAHHHPAQEERFQVTDGQLLFRIDGRHRRVTAGQEVVIATGAVHQVRNDTDAPAVAVWQTRPAGRTAEFLCAVHDARTNGALRDVARVVHTYGDVFRLDIRPRPVVGAAVAALASIADGVDRLMDRRTAT